MVASATAISDATVIGGGSAREAMMFAGQTAPAPEAEPRPGVVQYVGFSLHAGIGLEADQRATLDRLTRYMSRPPVAVERLALTAQGHVRYRLKTS